MRDVYIHAISRSVSKSTSSLPDTYASSRRRCRAATFLLIFFPNADDKLSSRRSCVELSIRETHYSARSEVIEVARLTPRSIGIK